MSIIRTTGCTALQPGVFPLRGFQSLKKAGVKIPDDIAFAGFNNDLAGCIIEPNLTTIDYKGYELGEVAAKILIGHLENNDDLKQTRSVILRSELIVRESSLKKRLHS